MPIPLCYNNPPTENASIRVAVTLHEIESCCSAAKPKTPTKSTVKPVKLAVAKPALSAPPDLSDCVVATRSYAQEYIKSINFVFPLFFRSEDTCYPYYCGGTCFAAKYHKRFYVLTARHCLENQFGEAAILGPQNEFFPIKQDFSIHRTTTDDTWTDVCCFSTHESRFWQNIRSDNYIDFEYLESVKIEAESSTFIAIKGFPDSLSEIGEPKIVRRAAMHVGFYGGQTNEHHCHIFDNIMPPFEDPNGLSGSPVFKIDYCPNRECESTLLGMVVQGGKNAQLLRFIGVDVLIRIIKSIDDNN